MKPQSYIKRVINALFNVRFAAGQRDRLTANFGADNRSADSSIFPYIQTLRDRARKLERDDASMVKWLDLLVDNVLGHKGIMLDMKVVEQKRDENGRFYKGTDDAACLAIKTAWNDWCRKENCDISGASTFLEQQILALTSTARDGDVLVQFYEGKSAGNPYNFAIRLFEADQLDHRYIASLANGNHVHMGVELDGVTNKVVAYYFIKTHPGDMYMGQSEFERVRVDADELYLLLRRRRIGQCRGYTWSSAALLDIKRLYDYSEAELVAAVTCSRKIGFFTKEQNQDGYQGEEDPATGKTMMNAEAGTFEELPAGVKVEKVDFQHPNTGYDAYTKSVKRQVAAGLGVSYTSLSGDLTDVNYTSIRAGVNDERERYKTIQKWFIDYFLTIVFERWLKWALLSGAIKLVNADGSLGKPLPADKFDKYNKPCWIPRRWSWVSPKDDIAASISAVNNGFTSRRRVIAESGGGDIEDVADEIEADNALFADRGITIQTVSGQMTAPGAQQDDDEEEKPDKQTPDNPEGDDADDADDNDEQEDGQKAA